jgi:hypothetical protein
MLHKQLGKEYLMVCYNMRYHVGSRIFWISPFVNSKYGIDFAILFTLRESRRTSDPVLSRDRGSQLQPFTLDASRKAGFHF